MRSCVCHDKNSGIQELLEGSHGNDKLWHFYEDKAGNSMENELKGMRLETGSNRIQGRQSSQMRHGVGSAIYLTGRIGGALVTGQMGVRMGQEKLIHRFLTQEGKACLDGGR